jgi:hypothetical protein
MLIMRVPDVSYSRKMMCKYDFNLTLGGATYFKFKLKVDKFLDAMIRNFQWKYYYILSCRSVNEKLSLKFKYRFILKLYK